MQLSSCNGCPKGCTCGATGCPGSTTLYHTNSNYVSYEVDDRDEWEELEAELKDLRWKRRQESDPGCPICKKPKQVSVIRREKVWLARVLNCARQ